MDVRVRPLKLNPFLPSFDRATPHLLADPVTGINAFTIANTDLYTVPAGRSLLVTGAHVDCTAAAGISAGPAMGVGINAGADDIFASTTVTGFQSAIRRWSFSPSGLSVQIPAGSVVRLGVDTAPTGTSMTVTARLFGVLL